MIRLLFKCQCMVKEKGIRKETDKITTVSAFCGK
jgi:hypothetical protein